MSESDNLAGLDPRTVCAHSVRAPAPESLPPGAASVPSAEPIYQTTAFDFHSLGQSQTVDEQGGYVYSRFGLPNGRTLERTMAALEGGDEALATCSGMAALGCALMSMAKPGKKVLFQQDGYGGTVSLLREDFQRLGTQVEAVDVYDLDVVAKILAQGPGALIVETISNPLCLLPKLEALASLCKNAGVRLIVDNTFATPWLARPLSLGADLVLHSASKFLGGHHDLTAGVLVGSSELIAAARGVAKRFGAVVSPLDAWLTTRGLRTLPLRMERASENARALCARLKAHASVEQIHDPGLGAMFSFVVPDAARVVEQLQLIPIVPSLGGTITSISHPATSSHTMVPPEIRAELGISEGLLRISTGIEDVGDLWQDLDQALQIP